MSEVSATLKAKVQIVCPKCGELLEIKLEGLSNYEPEEKDERTNRITD